MKNEDDEECFKWCVARYLKPVKKNSQEISNKLRKKSEESNWSGIPFLVELNVITKFEKQNSDIDVNVLGFEKNFIHLE